MEKRKQFYNRILINLFEICNLFHLVSDYLTIVRSSLVLLACNPFCMFPYFDLVPAVLNVSSLSVLMYLLLCLLFIYLELSNWVSI